MLTQKFDLSREAYIKGDIEASKLAHEKYDLVKDEQGQTHHKKHLEEHQLEGNFVKSLVYGGVDGAITNYAVVCGVVGAGIKPSAVIAIGMANMIGDGLSMGLGDFISSKSEKQFYEYEKQRETWEYENYIEGEKQEIYDIYVKKGMNPDDAQRLVDLFSKYKGPFINIMMLEELGLLAEADEPVKNGIVHFCSFATNSFMPCLPFFFGIQSLVTLFILSTLITSCFLFLLGVLKSKFSVNTWYINGFETLSVGAIAAFVSYLIGLAFSGQGGSEG